MKRFYSRFRVGLMAFAIGLAAVYMAEGLSIGWGEVRVELPTAMSGDVLPVFIDNSRTLTREYNCGKDPRDEQSRNECADELLFEDRDMSRYARYETTYSETDWAGQDEAKRGFIWRHWQAKKRAYMIVRFDASGHGWKSEDHYFIEPDTDGKWRLVSRDKSFKWFYVDGEGTEVPIIHEHTRFFRKASWKIATEDGPYYFTPGTRYLEFENLTGDTASF